MNTNSSFETMPNPKLALAANHAAHYLHCMPRSSDVSGFLPDSIKVDC